MLEKQKARMSYGLGSKQFSNYVKSAISREGNSAMLLIKKLESRLDNVVLRAGFATTRAFARQMVSHGHIKVNGKKVNIPSYEVKIGDIISIREGSLKGPMFSTLEDRLKSIKLPAWLKLNFDKKEVTVDGEPQAPTNELLFNVNTVLEFFSR
jgi:small subunit ribosomal protein S4